MIAILYIATGKYSILWNDFYKSVEQYFCGKHEKEYFVFTDVDELAYEKENEKIHRIRQEAMPWPYPTLLRFSMFRSIKDELTRFDYIFFFNANAQVLETITEEMILPRDEKKEKLVVARHPIVRWTPLDFSYDRNPKCRAFVPYGFGKLYLQACLIGGTSKAFLKMTEKLAKDIDADLKHNIIARWHDESYVNKYIVYHRHYRILGKEFVRQGIVEGQKNYILMRPKELYFDVGKVKENPPITELKGVWKKLDKFSYDCVVRFYELRDRFRRK